MRANLDAAAAADTSTKAYVERLEAMVDEQRLPAGDELISEIERFLRARGHRRPERSRRDRRPPELRSDRRQVMRIGVIAPQGWQGEYDGWERVPGVAADGGGRPAGRAARLRVGLAVRPLPHRSREPTDEITFESFTSLSALAALTSRIRLGHIVICTAFRNPALTAKMISTMDAISGGRMELGIGAGWKRDEWLAYGYGFPPTRERLERLDDDLEVITRMLEGDRHVHATYEGDHSQVHDAINVPKPIQRPRVPIMVGGNGPNVTWRLAARFADELNLDGMQPDEVASSLRSSGSAARRSGATRPACRSRSTSGPEHSAVGGPARVARLAAYRELGLSRVMVLVRASATERRAPSSRSPTMPERPDSSWLRPAEMSDGVVATPARHLRLPGTRNLRDVGGYPAGPGRRTRWRTLLRTDALDRLPAASQEPSSRPGCAASSTCAGRTS